MNKLPTFRRLFVGCCLVFFACSSIAADQEKAEARLAELKEKLEAAVERGDLSREQAEKKMVHMNREMEQLMKARHEAIARHEEEFERLRRALDEKVEAGELSKEQAMQHLAEMKRQIDGRAQGQRGPSRDELYERVAHGLHAAVALGRLDEAEAEKMIKKLMQDREAEHKKREQAHLREQMIRAQIARGKRVTEAAVPTMNIRVYLPADQEAVIAIWSACGLLAPHNNPQLDIERKLAVDPNGLLVGELDGKLIATCMWGYEGHRGWINYLGVHPDHQRKGYAGALLADAEARLRALGCPKINLQVRGTNAKVLPFYEALGYEQADLVAYGKRLVDDPPA